MSDRSETKLLLSDVDGTILTDAEELTPASVAAVGDLRERGKLFTLVSGRPPRGMQMLVEPLGLEIPMAGFNGGTIVNPDMSVLHQRDVPDAQVSEIFSIIDRFGLAPWAYSGPDWFVLDADTDHVRKHQSAVKFPPTVVSSFDGVDGFAKIVGVSNDFDAVLQAETATREALADHVSVSRSKPYYLDVTHPDANKGAMADYLSQRLDLDLGELASIGDMPNDVLMFARTGYGIAMGNADPEVQRSARYVTTSNNSDGFANAVQRFVLRRSIRPESP